MGGVVRLVYPYRPRDLFKPYHARNKRWACIVAHRRFGKTVGCINDLIRRAVTDGKQDGRYGYLAPYYAQAKDVAWSYLKYYSKPAWAAEPNESELRVDLINGARIRLYGADNADRMRGLYFDGVVIDEPAMMRASVWGEVIRPTLSDRKGWATFIGTPAGHNHFHDIREIARKNPDWFYAEFKASNTGLLDAEELAAARADMTPEQFEQEFECSFEAAIMGAYFGKDVGQAEDEGRVCDVAYQPDIPVQTAWDLGIGDSTAIWFWQAIGDEIHVIDHYENSGFGLEHYAYVLGERYRGYGEDFVPHDAKARELGTGRTRVETLLSLRRRPRVVPSHTVEDGINAARVLFPKIWFDKTKCAKGLEALRQYRAEYDDDKRVFRNRPLHDWTSHSADAFRYMAMGYREIRPPKPEPAKGKTMREMSLNDMWKAQRAPERRI
jgi:phage terminase large subunit